MNFKAISYLYALLFLTLFAFLPIVYLIFHNLGAFALHLATIRDDLYLFYISFLNAFIVAVISTIFGFIFAFLFAKTNLLFKRVFIVIIALPLLSPSYLSAIGWADFDFSPFWAVIFSKIAVFTPISVFISFVALRSINPEIEEMGLLYTDRKGVIKDILLPNIYAYLFLSLFIVSILSFGESSIDNTLLFKSFSLEIFTLFSAMYDYEDASSLVIFLLFVLFMMLSIYKYFFSEKLHFDKFYQMEKVYTLSVKNQLLAISLILSFILLFIVTPFFGIFSNINIQALSYAIIDSKDAILHTFTLSLEVALLFCINSFIFATLFEDDGFLERGLKQIIFYIFLLPSSIYAISLIGLFNHSYFDVIYSSYILLVVAISLKYLAVGLTLSKLNLYKITPSQIDSAKLLGANLFYILRYIIIPSSKRIFWVLFLIAFIFSYREVDLGYLLSPVGYETISMHLLTTMANSKSSIIASNIFITMFLPLIPLFFLTRGLR